MPVTKKRRHKKQWWPHAEVQRGRPSDYTRPDPPPVVPAHGPRDQSVPDCPPDYAATPEQVATDQRAAVREAKRALGRKATVETVGQAACLHPFVVVRRLKEMGLTIPGMDWKPDRKGRSEKQKVAGRRFVG